MKLKVIEANSNHDLIWGKFVDEHPNSTIYHTLEWLKVIEEETRQKVLKLICMDEDEQIKGLFPLQNTKGIPFGFGGVPASKRLSSLPRTPMGGPLTKNNEAGALLLEKAIDIISKESGRRLMQIKTLDPDLCDSVSALNKYYWRDIYVKEIPDHPEEIRYGKSKNHAKIKWAVNKALQNNVKLRIAESEDDLKTWYRLYAETMRLNTTPARSFGFFKGLWDHLKSEGLMQLVLAELDQDNQTKIIAGSILLFHNKVVTHAFSGSSRIRNHIELRPNDFLHWYSILEAQKSGYKYYDFGEVSKNNIGLIAYKKKWDTVERKVFHYYYPKPAGLNNEELDMGAVEGIKEKFWQLLPLGLTTKLSKIIYSKL